MSDYIRIDIEQAFVTAANEGDMERVLNLLQSGMVDKPPYNRLPAPVALYAACFLQKWDIAQSLIIKGADPHIRVRNSVTAFHYALSYVNENSYDDEQMNEAAKTVILMLEHGFDLAQFPTSFDRTALHVATLRGNVTVMEAILAKGADINAQDAHGMTALMLNVNKPFNILPTALLLLEKGADLEVKNNKGQTVMQIASDRYNDGWESAENANVGTLIEKMQQKLKQEKAAQAVNTLTSGSKKPIQRHAALKPKGRK